MLNTVSKQTFSERFLGRAGGELYTVIIVLTALGTLNVKTFTFGRITQAAADRRYLPRILKTVERMEADDTCETTGEQPPSAGWFDFLQRPIQYRDGSIPL